MIKRTSFAVVAVLGICVVVPSAAGQDALPPAIAVDLNEGVYLYLSGEEDSLQYDEAIRVFTSVLERAPENASALLFRALSYGELGFSELKARQGAESQAYQYTMVLQTRRGDRSVESIDQEIAALVELTNSYETSDSLDVAGLAEWAIAREKLADLEDIRSIFEVDVEDAQFETLKLEQESIAQSRIRAENEYYKLMAADLRTLIDTTTDPQVPVRLLDVVANAKIARIEETIARNIVETKDRKDKTAGSFRQLRRDASRRFDIAANVLRGMITQGLGEEQVYRAKFLLGVILFRQAVPLRAENEPAPRSSDQTRLLQESLSLMKALADDPKTPALYAPYSAFYVGLILPYLAATEIDSESAEAMLSDAERYLTRAAQLDLDRSSTDFPVSRTNVVPALVGKQRDQIERLRSRTGAAAPPINDIRLSLGLGMNRDTNVELLGDNTGLPRGISRDEDWGFSLITAVDYTKQVTDKLTFGFQGRVSQLWHADVDEFDQQTYGGTIALQYQLAPKRDRFGPVFASLQYDYDYTLLGQASFLGSHAIRPSLRIFWDERRAESELYFRYSLRDYFEKLVDGRFNRDGHYFTFGFLHKHKIIDMTEVYKNHDIEPWGFAGDANLVQDDPFYPARYLEGRLLLEYGWDATDGDEFDQKRYVLGFGVGVPLPWGVDMDVTSTFEWGNYAHGSLIDFHRRPRRSLIQEYHLAFSRTFVLEPGDLRNRFTPQFDRSVMTLRALASWTEDDSNVVDRLGQAVFSYDRWIYGVTVGFAFN